MALDELRRQLATFAKAAKRVVGRPAQGLPSDWRPLSVTNPETGLPFTDVSAWLLIVNLLEGGHPLNEVLLQTPPGARALELLVDLEGSAQTLYIKIQPGAGCVIGRSFHYSYRAGLHGTPARVRRDEEE